MADTAGVEGDGGVSLMLTPVQLYAILNGKSISEGELWSNTWHEMPLPRGLSAFPVGVLRRDPRRDTWSRQGHYSQPSPPDCWVPPPVQRADPQALARAGAAVQIVVGGTEMAGGAFLLLTPDPTMLTKVGGSALTVHGLDVTQAAIRQLFSGKPVEDYTHMSAAWTARQLGASDSAAERIGVILDVGVPLGAGGAAVVGRVLAIRAGRIVLSEEAVAGKAGRVSLDVEEADAATGREGGHTLERHVDKSHVEIIERAFTQDGPVSRFFSKQLAEDAINDAIRAKRFEIQQWAANPRPVRKAFDFPCNSAIGDSFNLTTGRWVDANTVRIVFKVSETPGRSFYLLTAFPVP